MYSLSQKQHAALLSGFVLRVAENEYELNHIEQQVDNTLPLIAGLSSDLSDGERLAIMRYSVSSQLKAFVARHGDAFATEEFLIKENVPLMSVAANDLFLRKSIACAVSA